MVNYLILPAAYCAFGTWLLLSALNALNLPI
jgi:hypothetical protein